MKKLFSVLICTVLCLMLCKRSEAVVIVDIPGNGSPVFLANYPTLLDAINALNTRTLLGPVKFTMDASQIETAPTGGYIINLSWAFPIIFEGTLVSGARTNIITAGLQSSGLLNDAIFKIIGSDNITIRNFIMQENSGNLTTNLMTEWGVALLYKTNTNGAQNNTIDNNDISLNKTYTNTFGVYSNVRHTSANNVTVSAPINSTNIAAPNSGNQILNNTISNVNMGIVFAGTAGTNMDIGNHVEGNTITNWASNGPMATAYVGLPTTYYGILMLNQVSDVTSGNTITNATFLNTGTSKRISCIYKRYANQPPAPVNPGFTSRVENNNINTITSSLSYINTSIFDGIFSEGLATITPATFPLSIIINGNNINTLTLTSNNIVRGIENNMNADILQMNTNTIRGITTNATSASHSFTGILQSASVSQTIQIDNNIIGDATADAITYTSAVPAISDAAISNTNSNGVHVSGPNGTNNVSVSGNQVRGFTFSLGGTANVTYISSDHTTSVNSTFQFNNNQFIQLNANTSAGLPTSSQVTLLAQYGVMALNAGAIVNCNGNSIVGSFWKAAGGTFTCYSSFGTSFSGNTMNEIGNNFSNISTSGNVQFLGWNNVEGPVGGGGPTKNITNNVFEIWATGNIASSVILCRNSTNCTISQNTVSRITSTSSNVTGIQLSSANTGTVTCSQNTIFSLTTPFGIGTGILNSGTAAVTNITRNKIYGITAPYIEAQGISFTACGPITNVQNNIIGDLTSNGSGGYAAPSCVGIKIGVATASSTFNVNYNTVHLSAASIPVNVSATAVYLQSSSIAGTSKVSLRNNILTNVLPVSGTGIAAAIWRSGTALNNYDGTSDNNDLYAGPFTTSPQHLIYYDGTNSDMTLAAYQARVGATVEDHSVSVLPSFISTTGSNTNYLHINSTGNCGIVDGGDNASYIVSPTFLTADDFDALLVRMVTAPYITDIGADEVSSTQTNIWAPPSSSRDWTVPGNWSLGSVPNAATTNVYIPASAIPYPQINLGSGVIQVNNLVIETGATLTNNSTLNIAGTVTAPSASIDNLDIPTSTTVTGSIGMNGCVPQVLGGNVFVNNAVNDFTVSNDFGVSISSELKITAELGFGTTIADLYTGDNVTLVSTHDRTANVGHMDDQGGFGQLPGPGTDGNVIAGKVMVERYINTGTDYTLSPPQHKKSWQLLATPTIGQTIHEAWQENRPPTGTTPDTGIPGYGTIIVGPDPSGTGAAGMDIVTTLPSAKTYVPVSGGQGSWLGISATSIPLYNPIGYMFFVRGDRSVVTSGGAATNTKMRSKGTLLQPSNMPTTYVTVGTNQYASVGNPYASSIDLDILFNNITLFSSGLHHAAWIWDPTLSGTWDLGGYLTISPTNGYVPLISKYLPGMVNSSTADYPDGVPFSNIQSGQAFFVKSMSTPPSAGTVGFNEDVKSSVQHMSNRAANPADRQFFRARLFSNTGVICDGTAAVFDDGYSNGVDADDAPKLLNGGENFIITRGTDSLSIEARDSVDVRDSVFYTFSNLRQQAYQIKFDPVNMSGVGLYATLVDNYLSTMTALSLAGDSVTFTVDANTASYSNRFIVVFDRDSALGRYAGFAVNAVKSNPIIDKTNKTVLSGKTSFSVYPNPVENKQLNLHFVNQPVGTYQLQLISEGGQLVYNGSIDIDGQDVSTSVSLNKNLAAGNYQLCAIAKDGKKLQQQVFIK